MSLSAPLPVRAAGGGVRPLSTVEREILARIPRRSRRIVDVGCGTGALGAALRSFDPSIEIVGIDADADAAAAARGHLDRVLAGDIEAVAPERIADPATVDCIVYGDLLQRLRDPWGVLRGHAPLLAPGGLMVASVPNFQNFRTIRDLVTGKWGYRRSGIADIAHLRFFTRDGALILFRQAGLKILSVESHGVPDAGAEDEHRRLVEAIEPLLRHLGIETRAFSALSAAARHTIVAGRAEPSRLLVQAIMRPPAGGLTDVRIADPLEAMASEPGIVTAAEVNQAHVALEPAIHDRILIWQRPFLNVARDARKIGRLIQRGYVVVVEIDDNPYHRETRYDVDEHFTFRGVHALQTSTEPLASVVSPYNPTCTVVRNQISHLPGFPDLGGRRGTRIFFGAFNRQQDWAPLMPAINRLLAARPDVSVDVVYDRAFFDALETTSKSFRPMVDYPTYGSRLAQADIALLPLADTPFNRTKSDLKFIESAAHGAVALASPVVYSASLVDGETGLLFGDETEFADRLEALITDRGLRHRLAGQAYAYVAQHRLLAQHYPAQLAWYRSLLARRAELNEALFARAPEIPRL